MNEKSNNLNTSSEDDVKREIPTKQENEKSDKSDKKEKSESLKSENKKSKK